MNDARISFSTCRRVLAIVLLLTLGTVAQDAHLKRALPLNRFPDSRLTNTDAQGFYEMPTGIGDDYFDGTDSAARIRRHMQVAQSLGVKYLRCAFSWNGIEHEKGVYNWRFWDRLVDEAERFHIQLIPYVAYTPEWAARSRLEYWRQPPRSPDLYSAFMERIAARYHGRIHSWELWNEPDLAEYWKGTPEEFAQLIRAAAPAVRRGDPSAVIVLGGMSLGPSPFFVKLMQQEKIAGYVDVIAQHGYPESWDWERGETIFYDWTRKMEELIRESRSGADFWLNEIGYPDYRYTATNASKYGKTDVYYDYEHTAQYQAVFLFKSFVMALVGERASLTVWYRIDDFPKTEKRLGDDVIHFHLGVVDERGQPKSNYRAFQFFNRLFGRPTRTVADKEAAQRGSNSFAIVNIFERKDGEVVVAGWLRSSEHNEVREHTGMLRDERSERVMVQLPCRSVPAVKYFNVYGDAVNSTARIAKKGDISELVGVPLRGDSVFIASAQCVN